MVKAKRRRKNIDRNAIREIKKYQKDTKLLIPRSCFTRLARYIASDYGSDLRFQGDALESLQSATEAFLVKQLDNANKIALHNGRCTLKASDLTLATSIALGDNAEKDTFDGYSDDSGGSDTEIESIEN